MIAHLSGTVLTKKHTSLVLDVSGVGYRIFCTESLLQSVSTGDELAVHTYHVIKENVLDLYGFSSEEELELFQLLISVNGVGPRSALGIMNLETFEKLLGAIAEGDVGYLTKVSGVGKKVADKIVLELRDKVAVFDLQSFRAIRRDEEDVLEALKTLGYRADEAREALRRVPEDVTDQSTILKEALKLLS